MFEFFGLVFGGVSRLAQHWMDLREKENERRHEAVMYDKQIELADKRFAHDASMRTMDAASADAQAEWQAIVDLNKAQSQEAAAAGGTIAKLSASVRPVLAYWFVLLYSASKAVQLILALRAGVDLPTAVAAAYTTFDGTVMASVVSFYFADRGLRKK